MKYYSNKELLSKDCDYNIIIGERSNGKTYAFLKKSITDYIDKKTQSAYLRRWKEDIIGKRADNLFSSFDSETLFKLTKGQFDNVVYSRGKWYLALFDNEKKRMLADKEPFMFAFSLSEIEHDKSTSYPNIKNVIFDEFLTRKYYLPDEFIIFMNVLSTIIRQRNDVKIFMLGNTVNRYCPYFEEMGLSNIQTQKQGTIDIYTFANNLKVAVEYCSETDKKSKRSNKYFSFDNPRLNMITSGKWELAIYPHLNGVKILPKDIMFHFGIIFNNNKITCEVIDKVEGSFIFCHRKTTDFNENEIVYTNDYNTSNFRRKTFLYPIDKIDEKIRQFFMSNRFFYQSNEIGEEVHNFLLLTSHK